MEIKTLSDLYEQVLSWNVMRPIEFAGSHSGRVGSFALGQLPLEY